MKNLVVTIKAGVQDHDVDVIPSMIGAIAQRFSGTAIKISEIVIVSDDEIAEKIYEASYP